MASSSLPPTVSPIFDPAKDLTWECASGCGPNPRRRTKCSMCMKEPKHILEGWEPFVLPNDPPPPLPPVQTAYDKMSKAEQKRHRKWYYGNTGRQYDNAAEFARRVKERAEGHGEHCLQ